MPASCQLRSSALCLHYVAPHVAGQGLCAPVPRIDEASLSAIDVVGLGAMVLRIWWRVCGGADGRAESLSQYSLGTGHRAESV